MNFDRIKGLTKERLSVGDTNFVRFFDESRGFCVCINDFGWYWISDRYPMQVRPPKYLTPDDIQFLEQTRKCKAEGTLRDRETQE